MCAIYGVIQLCTLTIVFDNFILSKASPSCGSQCYTQPIACSDQRGIPCTCLPDHGPSGCTMQNCALGNEDENDYACYCVPGYTGQCYDSGCTDYMFDYNYESKSYYHGKKQSYGYGQGEYGGGSSYGGSYDHYGINDYSHKELPHCLVGMCKSEPLPCKKTSEPLVTGIPCTCEPDEHLSPPGCRMRHCRHGDSGKTSSDTPFQCLCTPGVDVRCWNDRCSDPGVDRFRPRSES